MQVRMLDAGILAVAWVVVLLTRIIVISINLALLVIILPSYLYFYSYQVRISMLIFRLSKYFVRMIINKIEQNRNNCNNNDCSNNLQFIFITLFGHL